MDHAPFGQYDCPDVSDGRNSTVVAIIWHFALAFLRIYLTFAAPIKKFFIEWLWESCLEYGVITKKNL
jgi:hypothetical protein